MKTEGATEIKVKNPKDMSPEETKAFLEMEGPVEGYAKPIPDVAPETEETNDANETAAAEESKPAKTEGAKEETTQVTKRDFFVRVEQELAKPAGKEDLADFSPREKAYYSQMRRDRKARQDAEADRDAANFRALKAEKQAAKTRSTEEAPNPLADLEKRDPTDYISVADAKKIVEGLKPAANTENDANDDKPTQKPVDPQHVRYLQMCDNEARAAHPEDYDAVMDLTQELVLRDPVSLKKVKEAIANGENPAEVTYDMIKKHSEFVTLFPAAQTRIEALKKPAKAEATTEEKTKEAVKSAEDIQKEEAARRAEKALETNQNKTKTTAHVGAGEGRTSDDLSLEDIGKMPDKEFAKLPRKTRERYLKMYG